jgi:hypothetical protein
LRISTLLFIGTVALSATAALPAHAITLGRVDVAPPSSIVEVGGRCGEHMHFVRTHHDKDGHLVHGHCVHDKR